MEWILVPGKSFSVLYPPQLVLYLLRDCHQDPIQRLSLGTQFSELSVESFDVERTLPGIPVRQAAWQSGVTHEEIWISGHQVCFVLGDIELWITGLAGVIFFCGIAVMLALGHSIYRGTESISCLTLLT